MVDLDGERLEFSHVEEVPLQCSNEYTAVIVETMVLHRPSEVYGNVRNASLIDNLPDGCVEVAYLVDSNGVQPCHFGRLQEQLAALNRSHMAVHTLIADAVHHGDKESARYALMLDPLTAAVLPPAEICALFDEMWEAEREYLPAFA